MSSCGVYYLELWCGVGQLDVSGFGMMCVALAEYISLVLNVSILFG